MQGKAHEAIDEGWKQDQGATEGKAHQHVDPAKGLQEELALRNVASERIAWQRSIVERCDKPPVESLIGELGHDPVAPKDCGKARLGRTSTTCNCLLRSFARQPRRLCVVESYIGARTDAQARGYGKYLAQILVRSMNGRKAIERLNPMRLR